MPPSLLPASQNTLKYLAYRFRALLELHCISHCGSVEWRALDVTLDSTSSRLIHNSSLIGKTEWVKCTGRLHVFGGARPLGQPCVDLVEYFREEHNETAWS